MSVIVCDTPTNLRVEAIAAAIVVSIRSETMLPAAQRWDAPAVGLQPWYLCTRLDPSCRGLNKSD